MSIKDVFIEGGLEIRAELIERLVFYGLPTFSKLFKA